MLQQNSHLEEWLVSLVMKLEPPSYRHLPAMGLRSECFGLNQDQYSYLVSWNYIFLSGWLRHVPQLWFFGPASHSENSLLYCQAHCSLPVVRKCLEQLGTPSREFLQGWCGAVGWLPGGQPEEGRATCPWVVRAPALLSGGSTCSTGWGASGCSQVSGGDPPRW